MNQLTLKEKVAAIKFIVANWGKMTPKQMAENTKYKVGTITAWVSRLRKSGVDLPKRGRSLQGSNAEALKIALEQIKSEAIEVPKPY